MSPKEAAVFSLTFGLQGLAASPQARGLQSQGVSGGIQEGDPQLPEPKAYRATGLMNSFGSKSLQPSQAQWGKINCKVLSGKHPVLSWPQSDLEAVRGQGCLRVAFRSLLGLGDS